MMDIEEQEKRAEYLKLMAEISYLAVAVNEFTPYCVFLDFSGHVGSMSIEIAKSKEQYNERIASTEFYSKYHDAKSPRKVVENSFLMGKRDHLKSIMEEGEIPCEAMTAVQEIVTTYEF